MNNGRMNSRYEVLGQGKKAEKLIQWARDQNLTNNSRNSKKALEQKPEIS